MPYGICVPTSKRKENLCQCVPFRDVFIINSVQYRCPACLSPWLVRFVELLALPCLMAPLGLHHLNAPLPILYPPFTSLSSSFVAQ